MRDELVHSLINIQNNDLMNNMIKNMNINDISTLFSLLEYTDENTQNRWKLAFNHTMKPNIHTRNQLSQQKQYVHSS